MVEKITLDELCRQVSSGKLDSSILFQAMETRGRKMNKDSPPESSKLQKLKSEAGQKCEVCGNVASVTVECSKCQVGVVCVPCFANTVCPDTKDHRHVVKSEVIYCEQMVRCRACMTAWRPVLRFQQVWHTDCPTCKRRYSHVVPHNLDEFEADRKLEVL